MLAWCQISCTNSCSTDDIEEDTYEPPDRWVILSSLAILLLGAGVLYYVFTVPLEMNAVLIE